MVGRARAGAEEGLAEKMADGAGVTHVFFDCDDCCYQNAWSTAAKITTAIAEYTESRLGVDAAKSYELYKKHGTCLKGLLVEGIIDNAGVEDFLVKVHDISYDDIAEDPRLRAMVLDLKPELNRYVFTASTKEHAMRCLTRVGIHDCFPLGVVDTRVSDLESKHSTHAFLAAMQFAGLPLQLPPSGPDGAAGVLADDDAIRAAAPCAGRCLLLDDSVKNIITAKRMGWVTVLVGKVERDSGLPLPTPPEADHHLSSLHDLPSVLPSLFAARPAAVV